MQKDRIFGLCLILFCALLWFGIIPAQTDGAEEAFVPRLTVLFIAVPSLVMFLRRSPAVENSGSGDGLAVFLKAVLPTVLLFLAFLIAVDRIGFFAAGLLFSVCALLLFGERRKRVLLFTPPGMLGVVYLVIVHVLKFGLPQGILF